MIRSLSNNLYMSGFQTVNRTSSRNLIGNKGSFNNYVGKRRRKGVSRKSTLGHVTKGRYHVKCSQLSTRGGGEGVKIG